MAELRDLSRLRVQREKPHELDSQETEPTVQSLREQIDSLTQGDFYKWRSIGHADDDVQVLQHVLQHLEVISKVHEKNKDKEDIDLAEEQTVINTTALLDGLVCLRKFYDPTSAGFFQLETDLKEHLSEGRAEYVQIMAHVGRISNKVFNALAQDNQAQLPIVLRKLVDVCYKRGPMGCYILGTLSCIYKTDSAKFLALAEYAASDRPEEFHNPAVSDQELQVAAVFLGYRNEEDSIPDTSMPDALGNVYEYTNGEPQQLQAFEQVLKDIASAGQINVKVLTGKLQQTFNHYSTLQSRGELTDGITNSITPDVVNTMARAATQCHDVGVVHSLLAAWLVDEPVYHQLLKVIEDCVQAEQAAAADAKARNRDKPEIENHAVLISQLFRVKDFYRADEQKLVVLVRQKKWLNHCQEDHEDAAEFTAYISAVFAKCQADLLLFEHVLQRYWDKNILDIVVAWPNLHHHNPRILEQCLELMDPYSVSHGDKVTLLYHDEVDDESLVGRFQNILSRNGAFMGSSWKNLRRYKELFVGEYRMEKNDNSWDLQRAYPYRAQAGTLEVFAECEDIFNEASTDEIQDVYHIGMMSYGAAGVTELRHLQHEEPTLTPYQLLRRLLQAQADPTSFTMVEDMLQACGGEENEHGFECLKKLTNLLTLEDDDMIKHLHNNRSVFQSFVIFDVVLNFIMRYARINGSNIDSNISRFFSAIERAGGDDDQIKKMYRVIETVATIDIVDFDIRAEYWRNRYYPRAVLTSVEELVQPPAGLWDDRVSMKVLNKLFREHGALLTDIPNQLQEMREFMNLLGDNSERQTFFLEFAEKYSLETFRILFAARKMYEQDFAMLEPVATIIGGTVGKQDYYGIRPLLKVLAKYHENNAQAFLQTGEFVKTIRDNSSKVKFCTGLMAVDPEQGSTFLNNMETTKLDYAIALKLMQKGRLLEITEYLEYFNAEDQEAIINLCVDEAVKAEQSNTMVVSRVVSGVVALEFSKLNQQITSETPMVIGEDNWMPLVMAFVRVAANNVYAPRLPNETAEAIQTLFASNETKDFCLRQLQHMWRTYLDTNMPGQLPYRLTILVEFIADCGGAGPMSQFEALSAYIQVIRKTVSKSTPFVRTQREILQGEKDMEQCFVKDRWSNEDQAGTYRTLCDVLKAAPSLLTSFQKVFITLTPSQRKRFVKETFPLYRAQLAVMNEIRPINGANVKTYAPRDLAMVRKSLQDFTRSTSKNHEASSQLRQRSIDVIAERFQKRFGITRVPEQFTTEHLRSLTNTMLYLANMAHRSTRFERTLSWYLALLLNDQWSKYKEGVEVDPWKYLTSEVAGDVNRVITHCQELNAMIATNANISKADLPNFQKILQQEISAIAVGNVETVDVKFGNVVMNLHTLEDPDLYQNDLDAQQLQLLREFGNTTITKTVAKLYQQLSCPEQVIEMTAVETAIQERMQAMLRTQGYAISTENVQRYFQDDIKPLVFIVDVLHFVKDTQVESVINGLRKIMQPSAEIITIFNRLGEEFTPTSGALALTQDLDYLSNSIVRYEAELKPEEKTLLTEHISTIREQVVVLQTLYEQLRTKFSAQRGNISKMQNIVLRDKFIELDQMINAADSKQTITSTMTGDLNMIIENIRECLSCIRSGSNNDTNLTFGDSNKFFLYSHTESQQKGSVADQIVFLEPITHSNGTKELSFVFDRMYGSCTPSILSNHIVTVLKKYRVIKERFSDCTMSLFVTQAALTTSGLSETLLIAQLNEQFNDSVLAEVANITVDVVPSAAADHYVEFGGNNRTAGERVVNGVIIRWNAQNS